MSDECFKNSIEQIPLSERIELKFADGLTIRAISILTRAGIIYLDELVQVTPEKLKKFRGIGKLTFNNIRDYLEIQRLVLKNEKRNLDVDKSFLFDLAVNLRKTCNQVDEAIRELRRVRLILDQMSNENARNWEKM